MDMTYIYVAIGIAFVINIAGVTYATDCPDGFVSHQGICYKEFAIRASWEEAITYCEAYGAELATVTNEVEQTFLAGYLQRLTKGYFNSGIFWLGATDTATEGTWTWKKTGNSLSYTNWKNGEPNNAGQGEDCLTMTFNDKFTWNDNDCNFKFNFVCEIRFVNNVIVPKGRKRTGYELSGLSLRQRAATRPRLKYHRVEKLNPSGRKKKPKIQ